MEPVQHQGEESIDFSKLGMILRMNWPWLLLLFFVVNAVAYLGLRYTKRIYESSSEIKLDVKTDASEFGITTSLDDQHLNIIAGEIEIIKSRLFLSRVIEESDLDVSFISQGRVLEEEMFSSGPAHVRVVSNQHSLYNTRIYFKELNPQTFELVVGENGKPIKGSYGDTTLISKDLRLVLERNNNFRSGDEVGYYFLINSQQVLLDYLVANLSAEPLNINARTIRVTFKDHNPHKAFKILNKINTLYLEYSNEQKNLANKQKIDWLTNELSQIERRMDAFENYFEEFTLRYKTNSLDENLRATIQAINQVDSQRYELTRRMRETDRFISDLERHNFGSFIPVKTSLPESILKNIDLIQQRQLELERMKLSYNERTFAFQEKEKEIQLLSNKTLKHLREYKIDWQNRLDGLNRRKKDLEQEFADFPNKNTEFTKNQRFYKLYEEFYLTLMQSKSQFEIAQAGTTPDFKILSPASVPEAPISPNRPTIIGIGLVASVVLNFFLVGILYLANNEITSIHDLEKFTGASVIGSVPTAKNIHGPGLYIKENPKSMASEAMRALRTNLDFFSPNTPQKIIAISSTVSGEGKSFIATSLATVLALSKKRVILVDLDMRKMKTDFQTTDNAKGVSTILIKKNTWQECLVKTELETFDLLPSGPYPPNPSELLVNGEFSDLLANLRANYDFIILDTPPVGLVTDGIMAMRKADLSMYIFRANYSKKDFLSNLRRIVQLNKFTNVTTVLNGIPSTGKTYGYSYYEEKSPGPLKYFRRK